MPNTQHTTYLTLYLQRLTLPTSQPPPLSSSFHPSVARPHPNHLQTPFCQVSLWHDIPLFTSRDPVRVNFVCEIPKFSRKKYEIATKEADNPIKQDEKKVNKPHPTRTLNLDLAPTQTRPKTPPQP